MSDLDKLIEAVEGGNASNQDFDAIDVEMQYSNAVRAYHGSLDAAKALHEALLPEWKVLWDSDCQVREVYGSRVTISEWTCYGSRDEVYDGFSEVPARSWLIAILKAYRHSKNAHSSVHKRTP